MPPRKFEDPLPTPEARETFIETLKQEDWLVAINEKLSAAKFSVDDSITNELKGILKEHNRTYRETGHARLPVVRYRDDLLLLQEENAKCLAHRDRVSEIVVSYLEMQQGLDSLWDKAEQRLQGYTAYKVLTNARARELFVLAVLSRIHTRRVHCQKVLAMAEDVKESLTHTHFTIKQQAELGIAYINMKSA